MRFLDWLIRIDWTRPLIQDRLDALDLAAEFAAEGRSWLELGPDGTIIRHEGSGDAGAPRSDG